MTEGEDTMDDQHRSLSLGGNGGGEGVVARSSLTVAGRTPQSPIYTSFGRSLKSNQLRMRISRFRDVEFTHVLAAKAVWQRVRDADSGIITVIFPLRGEIVVSSDDRLLTREPDVTVIFPGCAPLRFEAKGPLNECLAIRIGSSIYEDIIPANGEPEIDSAPLDITALRPMLSFVLAACAMGEVLVDVARNIEAVSRAVARGLLLSALGAQRDEITGSVYSMAREYVTRYYADQSIGVKDAARYMGVSVRKLQVDLKKMGLDFTTMLRRTRALAAMRMQRERPCLKQREIMRACGFGSTSSLHRAIREFAHEMSELSNDRGTESHG